MLSLTRRMRSLTRGQDRLLAVAGCCAAAALIAGCGTSGPAGPAARSPGAAPGATDSGSALSAPAGRRLTKILVIMDENHSIQQVFPGHMPYLGRLARRYARAVSWSDVGHPSLPNYLGIFGGSAFNQPQDCMPGPGCDYPGPSVFGQAIARGKTAKSYEESMPVPCDKALTGNYDPNHNPWTYFPDEARLCRADDVPAGTVAGGALISDIRHGTLPDVGLITPNLIDDAHNGTLADADRFLRTWVPRLMSGPDWRAGRLAIVVTFDEGETTEQVPAVIIAPGLSGAVLRQPVSHYALTRLIDRVIGAAPLRHAATAGNLAGALGLHVGG
jgi:phosphatidylinositol-3-phosphatase